MLAITPNNSDAPEKDPEVSLEGVDLSKCHGGIMRIGRTIIMPAILALGLAGSILAGSAAPAVAAQAPAAPSLYYHWNGVSDLYYHW